MLIIRCNQIISYHLGVNSLFCLQKKIKIALGIQFISRGSGAEFRHIFIQFWQSQLLQSMRSKFSYAQADGQADKQTGRQTERQQKTDRHGLIHSASDTLWGLARHLLHLHTLVFPFLKGITRREMERDSNRSSTTTLAQEAFTSFE